MHIRAVITGLAFVAGIAGTATAAQAPQLAALNAVEPGLWQLSEQGGASQKLCITDPRMLLQIQHRTAQCSRFVIASDARSATVHYTCPGAGHGRTTIGVVDATQFGLQTQGILEGAPFDTRYEGRRLGSCDGANAGHMH